MSAKLSVGACERVKAGWGGGARDVQVVSAGLKREALHQLVINHTEIFPTLTCGHELLVLTKEQMKRRNEIIPKALLRDGCAQTSFVRLSNRPFT